MAKIGRPGLSLEKKAELWARWKSGQCASDIARALERTKGAIHHVLAFNGGIAPVARRRGPLALVHGEREEISRGMAVGRSIRSIAAGLGRSPSTVSREGARHGERSAYRATEADARARSRAGMTKRSGGVWYLFEASRSSIWTEVDNTQVALMASRWTSHFCVAVELAHRERLLKRGDHHG